MDARPDILCIGSAQWDVIGHAAAGVRRGEDLPGRVIRRPGGVALNLAAACARAGLRPALLTARGDDAEGLALETAARAQGIDMALALVVPGRATDRYLAIEDPAGLVAAVADAATLEAAGAAILAPLTDGRLGRPGAPWTGPVALDGNLPAPLLSALATGPLLSSCDLRLVAPSPAKAPRLAAFRGHPRATLHVNLAEAAALVGAVPSGAAAAAAALRALGFRRAVVTDGPRAAADDGPAGRAVALPPSVAPRRVTGAGDAFVAAHLAAERAGAAQAAALAAALAAAADWVAGAD